MCKFITNAKSQHYFLPVSPLYQLLSQHAFEIKVWGVYTHLYLNGLSLKVHQTLKNIQGINSEYPKGYAALNKFSWDKLFYFDLFVQYLIALN